MCCRPFGNDVARGQPRIPNKHRLRIWQIRRSLVQRMTRRWSPPWPSSRSLPRTPHPRHRKQALLNRTARHPTLAHLTLAHLTLAHLTLAHLTPTRCRPRQRTPRRRRPNRRRRGPAARTSPSATLRELIKERLRTHMGLYERVAALLRNRGKVTCRMATSPDDPVTETKPQSNSEGNAFAEGVLPQRATSSSQEAAPKDEAVQVVDALTPEKTVDAADIRRRRRKESRRRRRAHLESTFKDFTNAKFPVSKVLPWQYLMMDHADRPPHFGVGDRSAACR